MLKALEVVRQQIDDACTVQKLAVFLCVGEAGSRGIDQLSLMERANVGRGQVSKVVADLSFLTSKKEKGPDLVRNEVDPMNQRTRNVRLTPKGEKVFAAIHGAT
jgi:DNA-binding MarR family transcriptional regulator